MDAPLTKQKPVFSTGSREQAAPLKSLWLRCFNDRSAAVDLFFDKIFDPARCFTARLGNDVVSMLFLIPCKSEGKSAHYLYAACTAPEQRGKQIMSGLIDFALKSAALMGDSFSVLLPADKSLYSYYSKFGYLRSARIRMQSITAKLIKAAKAAENEPPLPFTRELCFAREKALKGVPHLLFNDNVLEYAVSLNSVYGGKTVVYENSYAIVSAEENGFRNVSEIIADMHSFPHLIEKIMLQCPAYEYKIRLPFEGAAAAEATALDFGMIKSLDGSEIPQNLYIGLTLD